MRTRFHAPGHPHVLAHRGATGRFVENTLPSFRDCVERGYDGIELDVMCSRDGRVFVFHDFDGARLTGRAGSLEDLTWDEIAALRLHQDGAPEGRVPLLEEVLAELGGRVLINVDVRVNGLDFPRREVGAAVGRVIAAAGHADTVIATCFSPVLLYALETAAPGVVSGLAVDDGTFDYLPRWIQSLGHLFGDHDGITGAALLTELAETDVVGRCLRSAVADIEWTLLDEDSVEKLHRRGLAVGTYTAFPKDRSGVKVALDDAGWERELHVLAAHGVDWIESDEPERVRGTLEG